MMVNGLSPFHIYQALFIIDRLTIINLIELPNDIQIRHIMLIVMQPRESRTLASSLISLGLLRVIWTMLAQPSPVLTIPRLMHGIVIGYAVAANLENASHKADGNLANS